MLSLLHLKKQTCLNSPCLFYCLLSYKAMLLSRNLYFHLPIHLQNYDSLASFAMTPSRPPTSWSCLIQETLRIQNVSHCPLAPWNSFLVFCDTTHWGFHPPSWLSSHPTDHISSVFITNPSSALLVNVSVPQRSISLFFFFKISIHYCWWVQMGPQPQLLPMAYSSLWSSSTPLCTWDTSSRYNSTQCWTQWMHTEYLLKNECMRLIYRMFLTLLGKPIAEFPKRSLDYIQSCNSSKLPL